MEQKKTDKGGLENKRTTGFLLGLVLVFSIAFVALEYTSHAPDYEVDELLIDELAQDLELLPAIEQQEMIAAQQPMEVVKVPEKIRAVDEVLPPEAEAQQATDMTLGGEVDEVPSSASTAEPLPPVVTDMDDNPLSFRIVEQLPEYPGGMVEFMKWLTKNLKYPPSAQSRKVQGRVVVSFIVNKDGTISDAKVVKPVDPQLDREAMRVVRMMPKWKPGMQMGKPCRTMFAIPIVFKL